MTGPGFGPHRYFTAAEATEFHEFFHGHHEAGAEQQAAEGEAAEQPQPEDVSLVSRRRRAELTAAAMAQRRLHAKRRRIAEKSAATIGWQLGTASITSQAEADPYPPPLHQLSEQFAANHDLSYVGGFFYCERCGATSTGCSSGNSGLLKDCSRRQATGGSDSRLRRLSNGVLPRTHSNWPDTIGGQGVRSVSRHLR